MNQLNFKEWLGLKDIYGFEKEVNQAQNTQKIDELPVKRLALDIVMERLAQNSLPLGLPKSKFLTEMQWGTHDGALRVKWTPKLNVKIHRLHHDREGNEAWILKKFFFVNDRDFAGQEDVVADEIFDQVKAIAYQNHDSVMEEGEFKFDNIVYSLAAQMRQQQYQVIEFERVKKLNENEYDLSFWVRGGGTGTLYGPHSQRPALALIVKMAYNERTGLIKAIAEMIQSVDNSAEWAIQPAEFEEYFLPTQPKNEIINSIVTSLKWF
jgi:hypothetical protein